MLVLESFFAGRTVGDGVFVNSWTQGERRFHVVIDGTWDGRVLALSESYAYADGPRKQKSWHLQQTAPGVFVGTYTQEASGPKHSRRYFACGCPRNPEGRPPTCQTTTSA